MIREENGQIIVDELRPMSDMKENVVGFGFHSLRKEFIEIIMAEDRCVYSCEDDMNFGENDFIGWIPMPIYRPKDGV